MSTLPWETVRSTQTRLALWVDERNAADVAATFNATVYEIQGRVRMDLPTGWSLPLGFWITQDGEVLDQNEWEES